MTIPTMMQIDPLPTVMVPKNVSAGLYQPGFPYVTRSVTRVLVFLMIALEVEQVTGRIIFPLWTEVGPKQPMPKM